MSEPGGDARGPYAWMLAGSLCFAGMGTFAHAAGAYFPWQTIAVGRSVVPLVLVTLWAVAVGVPLVLWRPAILWMRSVSGSVSLVCTFFALAQMPAPDVFTITNMFPIWVALLSWPMLGQFPSASVWLSVLCGVGGVMVIHPPTFLWDAGDASGPAVVSAVIASLSTAVAMMGLHRLKGIDTRAVVVHFSLTALVFAFAASWLLPMKTPEREPNPAAWAIVAGVGLTATAGQVFLTKAFKQGNPAKVSVVNLAQIPVTLILDLLFFDHGLDLRKVLGMTLVLGPTAWLMASQRAKKLPLDQEPPDE